MQASVVIPGIGGQSVMLDQGVPGAITPGE
jgi:hypothetical protein